MKRLLFFAALLILCGSVSCAYRRPYSEPGPQRDATIPQQQEERVEELERTEKTITGDWQEKLP